MQEVDASAKGKARDLLRRTAFGVNFALIGIESQETVDYKFPLRNLHYEVNQYEKQAAQTLMIYSGKEPWDGPMSLHDIIDFSDIPEELRCKTVDFPINSIDIRRLEDTSMFQSDVKHVFDFIRYVENKEKLYELVSTEPYYQAMDEDAYDVVSMYTNSKELVGIKEGIVEGIEQAKIENARNLLGLLSDEIIAEKIGLPLERVKSLHEQS